MQEMGSGLVWLGWSWMEWSWVQGMVQGMVFNGSFASLLQLQPQLQSNTLTATSSSLPCLVTYLFSSLLSNFSSSLLDNFSSSLLCLVTSFLPAYLVPRTSYLLPLTLGCYSPHCFWPDSALHLLTLHLMRARLTTPLTTCSTSAMSHVSLYFCNVAQSSRLQLLRLCAKRFLDMLCTAMLHASHPILLRLRL
jgi:hypothetical protein